MCMENLDVIYGDTRDRHGRERFLQFVLQEHYEGKIQTITLTETYINLFYALIFVCINYR